MTTLEQIADQITSDLVKSGAWLTIPHRKLLWSMIVKRVQPIVVEQGNFHFTDADAATNEAQNLKILALLKDRRSSGATNVELAKLALKYTSRLSQLRQQPFNYRIICTKEEGRVTRYRLAPEDW